MSKIGILGGSFDPVHYGHLMMANEIKTLAELDKVWLMPANVSPFKLNSEITASSDRVAMLKLAIADNKDLKVSTIEIKKKGPSYTFDTLNELFSKYPDDEFSLILGSDSFVQLDKWYEGGKIISMLPILVAYRLGDNYQFIKQKLNEYQDKYKDSDIKLYKIPEIQVSSTLIRQRIDTKQSIKYLTPDSVIKYIKDKELYKGLATKLKSYAKTHEKPSRYKHTQGVVKAAKMYALRYGADVYKAEVAAWGHDICRNAGNLVHAPLAAKVLEEEFHIQDKDILNAVKYHTTGRKGMCLLEKVIKMADLLEEGRTYGEVNDLRNALTDDIDESMLMLMEHVKAYVMSTEMEFDHKSDEAIEWLRKKVERKSNG